MRVIEDMAKAIMADTQLGNWECYVRMSHPARGGDVGQLNKYRWGRVVSTAATISAGEIARD